MGMKLLIVSIILILNILNNNKAPQWVPSNQYDHNIDNSQISDAASQYPVNINVSNNQYTANRPDSMGIMLDGLRQLTADGKQTGKAATRQVVEQAEGSLKALQYQSQFPAPAHQIVNQGYGYNKADYLLKPINVAY